MAADKPRTSQYAAFISYSHRDTAWARWLHSALERYRLPRAPDLAALPQRIGRCFRDDDESKASADLGQLILDALRHSRAMIVVCSPAAAQSAWVQKEIVEFKRLHGSDRVFALLVDGTPHGGADECLPAALKRRIGPAFPEGTAPMEPLAVDVRRLGRSDALLKLVAALLEVDFDQLKRRDEQRARRRLVAVVSTVAATLSVLAIAGWSAIDSARSARLQSIERLTGETRNALADGRPDVAVQALAALHGIAPDDPVNDLALRAVASQLYPVRLLVDRQPRPGYLQFGTRAWFLPKEGAPVGVGGIGDVRRFLMPDDRRFGVEVLDGGALVARDAGDGKVLLRLSEPGARIEWGGPALRPGAGGLALVGQTEDLNPVGVSPRLAYVSADGAAGQILDLVAGEQLWEMDRPVVTNAACSLIGRLASEREDGQYRVSDFEFLEFSTAGLRPVREPPNIRDLRLVTDGAERLSSARDGPCPVALRDSLRADARSDPVTRYDFPVRTDEASFWKEGTVDPVEAVASDPQPCANGRTCVEPGGSTPFDAGAASDQEFSVLPRRGESPRSAAARTPSEGRIAYRTLGAGNRLTRGDFCRAGSEGVDRCLTAHVALNSDVFLEHEHLFRSSGGRWAVLFDAAHLGGPFLLVDLQRLAAMRPAQAPRERISAGYVDFTPSDAKFFVASPAGELWIYAASGPEGAFQLQARKPVAAIPSAAAAGTAARPGDNDGLAGLHAIDETGIVLVRSDGVLVALDTETLEEKWRIRLSATGRIKRSVASPNRQFLVAVGEAGSQLVDLRQGFVLSPRMPLRAPPDEEPLRLQVGDDGTISAAAALRDARGNVASRRLMQRPLARLEGPLPEHLEARLCRPALDPRSPLSVEGCFR
jgi:hypothetical protein